MKKIYSQPEVEVFALTEDIVSTSGTYSFTGEGDFSKDTITDTWGW